MQILEPTTTLTDYILAILAFYFTRRIWISSTKSIPVKLWCGAFIMTGIAALAGGTAHGFATSFTGSSLDVIWKITVYAIGLASFFMLSGTVSTTLHGLWHNVLMAVATLKVLFYSIWMFRHNDFKYVIYDYVSSMLAVLFLAIYAFIKTNPPFAVWLITGIVISFVAAGIQQSGLSLHRHFNHNDLYHVVQMVGLWFLYRSVSNIEQSA